MTKKALPDGETWQVCGVDYPVLGYGATVYKASRLNETFGFISFYAPDNVGIDINTRFVVFGSEFDETWLKALVRSTTLPYDNFMIHIFDLHEA